MKYFVFALTYYICSFAPVTAQEIQINEDPGIAQIYRNWTDNNRANPHVEGWRAQILATTDRQQAEEARNRFRQAYPEVAADWVLEKPYYKLRAGAFRCCRVR